jgi:hypothetical protein
MREIEAWLATETAPLSRIGARLSDVPCFRPGQEAAAQAAMDLLLDHAAWPNEELEQARAQLASLPDIGQTLIAAQAHTVDLVDLAGLAQFLASVVALFAPWGERVMTACGLAVEPVERARLEGLYAELIGGQTRAGYILPSGGDAELGSLRERFADVRKILEDRQALALALLRTAGLAAYQAEFLVTRDKLFLLDTPKLRDSVRIVREMPEFALCAPRYDAEALRVLEEAQKLASEIDRREEVLMAVFTAQIVAHAPALDQACRWIAALDRLLARRTFVLRHHLQRAEVCTQRRVRCIDATYLPLREKLGERYTPLTLAFDEMAVLSGANMGGKTNALKTVALLLACVRRGLPVAAKSAECALYHELIWFGEEVDAEAGALSTFGQEMHQVRRLCEPNERRDFVFFDEFARSTTPREGRALSIGVFSGLLKRQAGVLAATHFEGIARACGAKHYRLAGIRADAFATKTCASVHDLEAAFDRRFYLAEAEEEDMLSHACDVAAALGVPDDILLTARKELSTL